MSDEDQTWVGEALRDTARLTDEEIQAGEALGRFSGAAEELIEDFEDRLGMDREQALSALGAAFASVLTYFARQGGDLA